MAGAVAMAKRMGTEFCPANSAGAEPVSPAGDRAGLAGLRSAERPAAAGGPGRAFPGSKAGAQIGPCPPGQAGDRATGGAGHPGQTSTNRSHAGGSRGGSA